MNLLETIVIMLFAPPIGGDNVMLGKPVKQSSVISGSVWGAARGNDGDISTFMHTKNEYNPYWQGDLQGSYRILNITVVYSGIWIDNAYIGASVLDVDDPGSDVIKCGQWPGSDRSHSLTFMCCFQQPRRFVRIWHERTSYLTFMEVLVEASYEQKGLPNYETIMSKRLTAPGTNLTVGIANECAVLCYRDESCTAFSFRQGGQLNCLLGINRNLDSATDWRTYILKDCYQQTACPGN